MCEAFEDKYRNELATLGALFGPERVARSLPRLKEIHEYTEARWHEYVLNLREGAVRYLLIGEAPPWSAEGTPQYLLDPASRVRTFMRAVRGTFAGAELGSSVDCLRVLAATGFLLLDSIPFAMNYSAKRATRSYDELIRQTVPSYLQTKIDSSGLRWATDIRVAFAVERNARSILRAITHLSVGGRKHLLSPAMVAVNRAGYPDSSKLQNVYGIVSGNADA
jgi:hypothetical protein